jgi:hypothetical protein
VLVAESHVNSYLILLHFSEQCYECISIQFGKKLINKITNWKRWCDAEQ